MKLRNSVPPQKFKATEVIRQLRFVFSNLVCTVVLDQVDYRLCFGDQFGAS